MKIYQSCILILILLLMPFNTVLAHKVIVFAWVEDGMIFTESKFASKRKVKNSPVIALDENGIIVHKGMTDNEGNYSFKIPADIDSDLVIKVEAGQGHQGQWRIKKENLLLPVTASDINAAIQEKQKLEKDPSIVKIMGGIIIIFILALGLKFFKRKKT